MRLRRAVGLSFAALPFLGATAGATAHTAPQSAVPGLGLAWNIDWWLWTLIGSSGVLYAVGLRRLWKVARPGSGIRGIEAGAFALGWLSLVVALLSPVDTWGDALFSMHMVQHELLMLVAAPLLILGRPLGPYIWALPQDWRKPAAGLVRRAGLQAGVRFLTRPLTAWIVSGAVLWIWHIPALFDAALGSEPVHTVQHLFFFVSALLFWWSILRRQQADIGYGLSVFYVITAGLHSSALAALLTFSATPWYRPYLDHALPLGLTSLEDQQLGGLIMWIPGGLIYLAATLGLMALWLHEPYERPARGRVGLSF